MFVAIAIFPLVLYSCLDNLAPLSFLTKIALTCGITIILYDEAHWFYNESAAILSNEEELNEIGNIFNISVLLGTTVFTFERTDTVRAYFNVTNLILVILDIIFGEENEDSITCKAPGLPLYVYSHVILHILWCFWIFDIWREHNVICHHELMSTKNLYYNVR